MKANKLMIGDWVMLDGKEPKQITGLKTHSCEHGYVQIKNLDCSAEYLEPVPLTPEILEKNGWVKDLYSNESYDNEELECLSLWVGEDGKNKWWWHVGVELVTPINYVHEFQHALRICGIEKEIIL